MVSVRLVLRPEEEDGEVEALLLKLDSQCFPDDERTTIKNGYWWIAYDGDEPVGYASLIPLPREAGYAWFSRAGVLPSARGKGLQRRMIRVRLAYARKFLNLKGIITYTLDTNWPSIASLIKEGFVGYDPDYAWVGRKSVLYWWKDLKEQKE